MSALVDNAHSANAYDAWELADTATRSATIKQRLEEYITYCRGALPFYGDRLGKFRATATYPLADVPVLTSQELRDGLPPLGDHLVASSTDPCNVFQSGGTTGMPKTAMFGHHELEQLDLPNSRGFFALGLTRSDRVANQFAVGGLYMTFIHIHRMLQHYGCRNFPFSNHTPADFVHTVCKLFAVNCFAGIASVVLDTLRAFPALGLDGIRIEKVFYGGEHLYDSDKEFLRQTFGTRVIAAPGYGTVDTWYIGYQCLDCSTGVFHAHDDQTYIEIIDEDSGAPCGPEAVGMLYATPFPRRLTPIVRYRVGDRAQWLGEACRCGRTTPLFKLLGRGDDVLRVGYDSVDYDFVQRVVTEVFQRDAHESSTAMAVQVQKQRVEGRDKLVVRVETALAPPLHGALVSTLRETLLEQRPSLKSFVAKGTVWPIDVELVPPSTLERNARTGKLIRVIDRTLETAEPRSR